MAFTKASHDSQIYECSMMEIKKYMNKGDLFDVGFEGSQTDLKYVSPQRFLKKKKKKSFGEASQASHRVITD